MEKNAASALIVVIMVQAHYVKAFVMNAGKKMGIRIISLRVLTTRRRMAMNDDLISRSELLKKFEELKDNPNNRLIDIVFLDGAMSVIDAAPAATVDGNTSDGYHTFNELYHHRAVLFSVIVKMFPNRAWKARQHYDGSMFEGMFIVGIETPDGQATYHYDLDPYWDMFKCRELEFAPEWDGHTAQQAIERIGKLKPFIHASYGYKLYSFPKRIVVDGEVVCGRCHTSHFHEMGKFIRFCPHCGALLDGVDDRA